MKRMIVLIWLLSFSAAWGDATVEDTSAIITFTSAIGMDSVYYSASQDTSSWEINRREMSRIYADSFNFGLIDTFDNNGDYWVKIEYWEGGATSAKYLANIKRVEPAWFDANSDTVDAYANIMAIHGDAAAAESLEVGLDGGIETYSEQLTTLVTGVNVAEISDSKPAADSAELVFLRADHSNIGETQYIIKGVVEDSIDNGALNFQTNLASTDDDIYNRQQLEFISGNKTGHVTQISDYVGTSGVVFVSPGLIGGAPNAGDSFKVTGTLAGLLANSTNNMVDVAASGNVAIDLEDATGDFEGSNFSDAYWDSLANRSASASIDYQAISDSVWLLTLSSGYRGVDTVVYVDTVRGVGGSASIPDSLIARVDTILSRIGPFGDSSVTTTPFTLYYWLYAVLSNGIDSIKTSLGYDASNDLHTKMDAIGSGTGNQPETVYVYDTNNTVTVPNIPIQARNSGGTNLGQATTNAEGYAVLNQDDAATIYVRISQTTGYVQSNNPETVSVASPYKDTVYVTAFSPTAPPGDLTTVYNWQVDGNDQPVKGIRVTAEIPRTFWPVTNSNKGILARHEVSTDSAGLWELPIFGNDIVLTDQGDSASYWNITGYDGAEQLFKFKMTVSSDSTKQLGVPDSD